MRIEVLQALWNWRVAIQREQRDIIRIRLSPENHEQLGLSVSPIVVQTSSFTCGAAIAVLFRQLRTSTEEDAVFVLLVVGVEVAAAELLALDLFSKNFVKFRENMVV